MAQRSNRGELSSEQAARLLKHWLTVVDDAAPTEVQKRAAERWTNRNKSHKTCVSSGENFVSFKSGEHFLILATDSGVLVDGFKSADLITSPGLASARMEAFENVTIKVRGEERKPQWTTQGLRALSPKQRRQLGEKLREARETAEAIPELASKVALENMKAPKPVKPVHLSKDGQFIFRADGKEWELVVNREKPAYFPRGRGKVKNLKEAEDLANRFASIVDEDKAAFPWKTFDPDVVESWRSKDDESVYEAIDRVRYEFKLAHNYRDDFVHRFELCGKRLDRPVLGPDLAYAGDLQVGGTIGERLGFSYSFEPLNPLAELPQRITGLEHSEDGSTVTVFTREAPLGTILPRNKVVITPPMDRRFVRDDEGKLIGQRMTRDRLKPGDKVDFEISAGELFSVEPDQRLGLPKTEMLRVQGVVASEHAAETIPRSVRMNDVRARRADGTMVDIEPGRPGDFIPLATPRLVGRLIAGGRPDLRVEESSAEALRPFDTLVLFNGKADVVDVSPDEPGTLRIRAVDVVTKEVRDLRVADNKTYPRVPRERHPAETWKRIEESFQSLGVEPELPRTIDEVLTPELLTVGRPQRSQDAGLLA